MVLTHTPVCEFGRQKIDFSLPDVDGKQWTFTDCRGDNGTIIMFICNHCPYVQSIIKDLVATTKVLKSKGVSAVAIMSNDYTEYPEDSPIKMKEISDKLNFNFPYLIDEDQSVAKAYGAVCTPDFFCYNSQDELQYRGKFDNLEMSMVQISATGKGPEDQIPSMGCNIKWKQGNG